MTGGRSDEENDRGYDGCDYIVQLIVLRYDDPSGHEYRDKCEWWRED